MITRAPKATRAGLATLPVPLAIAFDVVPGDQPGLDHPAVVSCKGAVEGQDEVVYGPLVVLFSVQLTHLKCKVLEG